MALVVSGLSDDMETLIVSPPPGAPACAQAWADAIEDYFTAVVPVSATVSTAAATMKTALDASFLVHPDFVGIEAAFLAFAATVGTGMAPAFVATPPPAGVLFATLAPFALLPDGKVAATMAAKMAALVDTWAKTGTATPSAGGPPVNWS